MVATLLAGVFVACTTVWNSSPNVARACPSGVFAGIGGTVPESSASGVRSASRATLSSSTG
jgi:hypothetical protein